MVARVVLGLIDDVLNLAGREDPACKLVFPFWQELRSTDIETDVSCLVRKGKQRLNDGYFTGLCRDFMAGSFQMLCIVLDISETDTLDSETSVMLCKKVIERSNIACIGLLCMTATL